MKKKCSHPYAQLIDKETGRLFCSDCRTFFYREKLSNVNIPLTLPPLHYNLTKTTWNKRRPWKNISFEIAKKYNWYISIMGSDDYLIMPVYWKHKAVFYSARRLTNNGGLKYDSPSRKKYPWVSGPIDKVVLIGEGVADAAYMSQIAPSIALLGSYYLDEIELLTKKNTRIIIILDPDPRGISAAANLKIELWKHNRKSNIVYLNDPKIEYPDPTDLTLRELKKQIKKQTGLKL